MDYMTYQQYSQVSHILFQLLICVYFLLIDFVLNSNAEDITNLCKLDI